MVLFAPDRSPGLVERTAFDIQYLETVIQGNRLPCSSPLYLLPELEFRQLSPQLKPQRAGQDCSLVLVVKPIARLSLFGNSKFQRHVPVRGGQCLYACRCGVLGGQRGAGGQCNDECQYLFHFPKLFFVINMSSRESRYLLYSTTNTWRGPTTVESETVTSSPVITLRPSCRPSAISA